MVQLIHWLMFHGWFETDTARETFEFVPNILFDSLLVESGWQLTVLPIHFPIFLSHIHKHTHTHIQPPISPPSLHLFHFVSASSHSTLGCRISISLARASFMRERISPPFVCFSFFRFCCSASHRDTKQLICGMWMAYKSHVRKYRFIAHAIYVYIHRIRVISAVLSHRKEGIGIPLRAFCLVNTFFSLVNGIYNKHIARPPKNCNF